MKICIISNTSWSIYNFRRTLIQKLVSEGHEVSVLAPDEGYYKSKILEWNCNFITLEQVSPKSVNPFANINFYFELKKSFKQVDPHVIFSFTPKPNIWGAIASRAVRAKFIPTINGLGHAFISKGWLSFLVALLYRFAFKGLQKVIFQNPDDAMYFLEKNIVNKSQSIQVPGSGVDLSQFYLAPKSLRKNEEIRFLYAGRLIKEKGILEYVKAATLLKKYYHRVTFFMKGNISDNPSSITKVEINNWIADNVVVYNQHTDDMSHFLNEVDVVVLPTYYREGIPKILIEACAKGIPIITTSGVGCNQIIRNKFNGLVVKEKSVESLLEAMKAMIKLGKDGRSKMGLHGRKLVEEKFDDKIVINTYLSLIMEKDKVTAYTLAETIAN